ncbi:IPT/TIG domain-containing protein [Flagellimonas sp.]|uniref:IPT/TIG domain-containing protein n=1 Tax=Flagellimonas sp. TaxID=2058762 RepID=UPI003BB1C996
MKKTVLLPIAFCLMIFSCGKDISTIESNLGAPQIEGFSPIEGQVGQSIRIIGRNFGSSIADKTVKIGNTVATVTGSTETEIFITIPDGAISGAISIAVAGQTTYTVDSLIVANELDFTADNIDTLNIILSENNLNLHTNEVYNLTATISGQHSDTIKWFSENPDIVTVDDTGNLTALQTGATNINARIGNVIKSCYVNVEPNIYVLGSQFNDNVGTYNVTLWINNEPFIIEKATQAGSIFVHNSDVYIAGESVNENGPYEFATVWKNGVPMHLSSGLSYAEARSVFVEAENVYVAGREWENTDVSKVWKNGELLYTLTDGTYSSRVHSVFVDDGDIYVAGYESVESVDVAKVWKNGIPADLSKNGNAHSVSVYDDIVFAAGFESNFATVWTNGSSNTLTNGLNLAMANSILLDGRKVYACGFERIGEGEIAILWENGTRTNLTEGVGHADANSIFKHSTNIYVAGWEQIGNMDVGKVWKNGELYFTLNTNGDSSRAFSIFVK